MKKFNLQLQNANGEVESEKEIAIGESDTLIMQFPDNMTLAEAHQSFELLKKGVENGGVIGMKNTISFTIIKNRKG